MSAMEQLRSALAALLAIATEPSRLYPTPPKLKGARHRPGRQVR